MEVPYRLAVVGTGRWGEVVARRIQAEPDLDLVAVIDLDPVRAAEVGRALGVGVASRPEDLAGQVDGAVVATPPAEHLAAARTLLDVGVPVLVEKPLAPDLQGARELVAEGRRRGLLVQPAFQERWNPAVRACGGGLAGARYVQTERLAPFAPRSLGTDVVLDLMIHDIDLCLAAVGAAVTEVRAVGIPVVSDRVDIAHVRLEFEGGAVATLSASRISPRPVRTFRSFGAAGYHSADLLAGTAYRAARRPAPPGSPVPYAVEPEALPAPGEDALGAQLRSFGRAARGDAPPPVTAEEGLAALALALRVREAIEDRLARVGP
ncbi:Gfo/Idh/MocA family oxidoreductase [Myxococcota bacterium]|nr:Gfo/Idh/MocA family oxidoreductase [Myxococcota bacterium]